MGEVEIKDPKNGGGKMDDPKKGGGGKMDDPKNGGGWKCTAEGGAKLHPRPPTQGVFLHLP